jgi:phosphonate transport system permease protein
MSGAEAALLAADRARSLRQAGLNGAVVLVLLVALGLTGFFDPGRFADGMPVLAQLAIGMVPPDFSRFPHWLRPLLDTLAMSIAGTALAVVLSLPLALNTTQGPASATSRGSSCRSCIRCRN